MDIYITDAGYLFLHKQLVKITDLVYS